MWFLFLCMTDLKNLCSFGFFHGNWAMRLLGQWLMSAVCPLLTGFGVVLRGKVTQWIFLRVGFRPILYPCGPCRLLYVRVDEYMPIDFGNNEVSTGIETEGQFGRRRAVTCNNRSIILVVEMNRGALWFGRFSKMVLFCYAWGKVQYSSPLGPRNKMSFVVDKFGSDLAFTANRATAQRFCSSAHWFVNRINCNSFVVYEQLVCSRTKHGSSWYKLYNVINKSKQRNVFFGF